MTAFQSFVALSEHRAARDTDKLACRYLSYRGGAAAAVSFGELSCAAKVIAVRLAALAKPGERVLLMGAQGLDYVKAFWGCLYGGFIAVPAYAPRNTHHFERLQTILTDAQPSVLLLSRAQHATVCRLLEERGLASTVRVAVIEDWTQPLDGTLASAWRAPCVSADDIAFLQYTSGSTGAPKGIMVTHRNLLANQAMIMHVCGNHRDSRAVFWVPLFHDMGLVSLLQGLYVGYSTYLLSPLDFLSHPIRWLQAISDFGATLSSAPDFAWQLCVDKVPPEQRAALNLSSLTAAVNGSEPISINTLEAFAEAFKVCGFRKEAFRPSYGLAEATLIVSGSPGLRPASVIDDTMTTAAGSLLTFQRVGCGAPPPGCEVRIIDPRTRQSCPAGDVGEIWVKGAHVARGYWNQPEATQQTFGNYADDGAGPFLGTGDLGFLYAGELVVTGRSKELMVLRGDKYYPSDLEATAVAAHRSVIRGGCAALLLADDASVASGLVMVAEIRRDTPASTYAAIRQAIVERVSATYGLALQQVVLTNARALPKTSSGKIQRGAVRAALMAGQLRVLDEALPGAEDAVAQTALAPVSTQLADVLPALAWQPLPAVVNPPAVPQTHRAPALADSVPLQDLVQDFMLSLITDALRVSGHTLALDRPMTALGLDSMGLVGLKHRIEDELRVDVPVELLFGETSLDDFITAVIELARRPALSATLTDGRAVAGPDDTALVTAGQTALWLIQQADPASSQYNEGFIARVDGPLDQAALRRALQLLAQRHDTLRCTFQEVDGQPVRMNAADPAYALLFSQAPDGEQALQKVRHALDEPFDLHAQTWRCHVAEAPGVVYLAIAAHHMVVDMWSFGLFIHDLRGLYAALVDGASGAVVDAAPRPSDYTAFAAWQRSWLDSTQAVAQREYWRTHLRGAPGCSSFPASVGGAAAGAAALGAGGAESSFAVDPVTLGRAKVFAQTQGLTLYQLLFATCALLLNRYADQQDVVVGMPALGRPHAAFAQTIGYFANVLPVRIDMTDERETVSRWLCRVKAAIQGGLTHQQMPLAALLDDVANMRDAAGLPLVQVVFSLLSALPFEPTGSSASGHGPREADCLPSFALGEPGAWLPFGQARLISCEYRRERARFDLTFTVIERNGALKGVIHYRSDRYHPALIERIAVNYIGLLQVLIAAGDVELTRIPYLQAAEWAGIQRGLSCVSMASMFSDHDGQGTVVDWFRRAAAACPQALALCGRQLRLTYAETERESNLLSQWLSAQGVVAGDSVVLACASRARQTLLALAVLKTGAAYVPVDVAYPAERISFIVRDCGAKYIVCPGEDQAAVPAALASLVLVSDSLSEAERMRYAAQGARRVPIMVAQTAYCIYTSGSTGQPKGVLATHHGLKNLVEWHVAAFDVTLGARAALLAGPGFDAAIWETWPYLCAGAALIELTRPDRSTVAVLATELQREEISHCFMPTPLAEAFLAQIGDTRRAGALRYLLTGGDTLKRRGDAAASFALFNAYGPTENTVVTTGGPVSPAAFDPQSTALLPDIGMPIRNQMLYILDRQLRPLPRGMAGALYISGAGLAHGYVNRPALTAERFMPNPYLGQAGARMFATRDIVCLDEAGRLHFLGRDDDQVQIRGFRVEPGEVEAVLMGHPQVDQCTVIAVEHASLGKCLAAYAACQRAALDTPQLTEAALRAYLQQRLPAYMRPALIVIVESLPVDANGKIARRLLVTPALLAPPGEPVVWTQPFEAEIAALYQQVLGVASVSAADDFFALGGHSLLVARIVTGVRQQLGVLLPAGAVFEYPRVADLAAHARRCARTAAQRPLERCTRPPRVPLSSAQRRLWLLQQLVPERTDYNICAVVRVTGALDLPRLEAAINQVVAAHEALRTCFPKADGEPYQAIHDRLFIPLEKSVETGASQTALAARYDAWERHCFDLQAGPLLRMGFIQTAADDGYWLLNFHHIVADGRSIEIFFDEIAACYQHQRTVGDAGAEDPEQALDYADYALWSVSAEAAAQQAGAIDFWTRQLAGWSDGDLFGARLGDGAGQPADLPTDASGAEVARCWSASNASAVREWAARHGVTEAMVYMAAYSWLLAKCGSADVLLGLPYDGRERPEVERMIGFFVNVLPIRLEVTDQLTFAQQVVQLRDTCAAALNHSQPGYDTLVTLAGAKRHNGGAELVRAMFDFAPREPVPLALGASRLERLHRAERTAKFDLTLKCAVTQDGLRITLNFRCAWLSQQQADILLDAYLWLLEQVLGQPALTLPQIQLANPAQAQKLLRLGAGRAVPVSGPPVFRLLEQIALAVPHHLAVVAEDGETRLTYGGLNVRANQLAHHLQARGIGKGAIVAIGLPPGPAFLIVALAVLKIGAAYTPVEHRYPELRQRQIVEHSGAALMIVATAAERLAGIAHCVAWSELEPTLANLPEKNPRLEVTLNELAYLIYTSGTTGMPKGVAITHRGLANLCQWHAAAYQLGHDAQTIRASQLASIGFDAAVWEMWPYLCAGASVWFAPEAARQSPAQLTRWLAERRITHSFLATPLAHAVLADGWTGTDSLRYLLTGGERLTSYAPAGAHYQLVNHYGPSENSVVATASIVHRGAGQDLPAIGAAIDNVTAYVLDRHGQLLPPGMPGELYLGGAAVMREYYGDVAATHERLLPDPLHVACGAQRYRTGDRVCWNAAGELIYLGRMDEQLKIRGYRIEPGEILAVVKAQPEVRDAVITTAAHADERGTQLVAYVVFAPLQAGAATDMAASGSAVGRLQAALTQRLPAFMVPSLIVALDALPLTTNGKVDYRSLPNAQPLDAPASRCARTVTEQVLAVIWEELLGSPVASVSANFFALGGHSLLAVKAVGLIETRLGREIALKDFFAAADLAGLARVVDAGAAYCAIPAVSALAPVPLSPYQQRLWLTQAFSREQTDYNVVGALRIDGLIEAAWLQAALDGLIERHPVLRTRIVEIDGVACQQVRAPGAGAEMLQVDLSGNAQAVQQTFINDYLRKLASEAFDLAQGAPLRAALIKTAPASAVLALGLHHLSVDAWSAQVLLRELLEWYAAALTQRVPQLSTLPIQYTDYSLWAARDLDARRDALLAFWRDYLHALPVPAVLPAHRPGSNDVPRAGKLTVHWPADIAAALSALAREQQASLYEVLLAACFIWLQRLSGATDLVLGTPYHDRGRPELENLVGFFVNLLPVRAQLRPAQTYAVFLQQLRRNLQQVYAHHALPFDMIAEQCADVTSPLFQILFEMPDELVVDARHAGLSVALIEGPAEAPIADLSVSFRLSAAGLSLTCGYAAGHFHEAAVQRWLENFQVLLAAIVTHPDEPISQLPILSEAEQRVIERLENGMPAAHQAVLPDGGACAVHTLFDRQALAHPAHLAIVAGATLLTYEALCKRTNQLAHYLLAQGVQPGMVVGIEAVHRVEALVAIIAVSKIGAICLPVDASLPPGRLSFILADSGCCYLLAASAATLKQCGGRGAVLMEAPWQNSATLPPAVPVHPDSALYLTYTSGTTGTPKAVVLQQRGIVNYIGTVLARFRYRETDRALLFAPLTFDAALEEIFAPLCAGASLCIDEAASQRSLPALLDVCRARAITILTLPTTYWRALTEQLSLSGQRAANSRPLAGVRLLSIGGEKATADGVRAWREATQGAVELWNIYGPSECSIGCIVDRIDSGQALTDAAVYLRDPVANMHLYVLDAQLNPVPAEMPGELYIGGAGVAHGYHRRPALTAERFVPSPLALTAGQRLYRSGDLVKYDVAGNLHYLGRADFQIKVDGMRVEPEEIEAALEAHPEVARAVVLAVDAPRAAKNPLCGYVTLEPTAPGRAVQSEIDGAALIAYLRGRLPPYMVPARINVLDTLPLTVHQKVDRRALALSAQDAEAVAQPVALAGSATETTLLALWRELLNDAHIGVTDDFFAIGGSSLLAIRLGSRIERAYQLRLPAATLFDYPTVRALAQRIETLRQTGSAPIVPVSATAFPRFDALTLPLSGAQRRLWYLQQLQPESTAYHLPDLLMLTGALEIPALQMALEQTVQEHESLRTTFTVQGDKPVQVIGASSAVVLRQHDLAAAPGATGRLQEIIQQALATPFDLEQGPLAVFTLVKCKADEYLLLSMFHHIVMDGWSAGIFQQSVARHYNAIRRGAPPLRGHESPRALQYRDFANWHNQLLDGGERVRQLQEWREVLSGPLPALALPTDFRRPPQLSGQGAVQRFALDAALSARLIALGQRHQVPLMMVLLTAYAALLCRYARQRECLIGVPALGRPHPELEALIGFFINTLVIRVRTHPTQPFAALLEQVRATCLRAYDHQDVPLDEIAAARRAGQDSSDALLQTMFSYQDNEAMAPVQFDGLTAVSVEPGHQTAKFDLYLATWTEGDGVHGGFEFSTDLFEPQTIARLAEHYRNLLAAIAAEPTQPLGGLPLLSAAEFAEQVHGRNQTTVAWPAPALVHDVFRQRAALHPERVAVSCGAESLTYAELDQQSDCVAANLRAEGACGEALIGLLLHREIGYLVALLGALKAGLPFTPLHPDEPPHQLAEIVRAGAVSYVVCVAADAGRARAVAGTARVLTLEALRGNPRRAAGAALPLVPAALAYVIYTSGSTGQPKGAMIEHRGLANHLRAKLQSLEISEHDVIAQMAVTTFDVSIWQYLAALLAGGRTAIIAGDAAWEPVQLLRSLAAENVTIFESVPSHLKIVLDALEARPDQYPLERLRLSISNGEALPQALCARWFASLPQVPIINTYGATECSDDTSHLRIDSPLPAALPYAPIHGTLPNLTTYLLDDMLSPVPLGVTGEIYLGGAGVGRGYRNAPARTAAVFVPDPFSSEPGQRLYKTGDLARWRPGEVLEFLGREDFQVKIRGQRVETGAVESVLHAHQNVRQAVVIAEHDGKGRLYLLGYVVPRRHPAPTMQDLRTFVAGRLADYMVPAFVVLLDALPLMRNGKIDRTRLPTPADQALFNRHDYVAPATATEQTLAAMWQELLEIGQVGALDSFFELGGHSLLAAELTLKVRAAFGIALPLRTVFEEPQLRALAQVIERAQPPAAEVRCMARQPAQPDYELAPCQIAEWYAYQIDPASPVYNISMADLFVTGPLNRDAFIAAWAVILERHEVLHVTFGYRDGRPLQCPQHRVTLRAADVFIDRGTLRGVAALDEANRLATQYGTAPFDFAQGPLFRLHLVSYADDFHQLIFVVHHIIWDETSLINLMRELSELYNAQIQQRPPRLPELSLSYFDYVQWLHQQLRSGAFDAHRRYWLDLYREPPAPLDLPTDYPRPNLMTYRGDAMQTWLPRRVVRKIEAFLKHHDVTLFMLQLALLDYYLYRFSGQRDFVVGCPIAGRPDPRLQPLLGLFATPMPIRCTIAEGMTFTDLLAHVSTRVLEAFEHYHYPSNQVIEQLPHHKDLSRPKLFSVMYGVQNNKTELLNQLQFDGLRLSLENVADSENKSCRFDLNFVVDQFGSDILYSCIYNTDLFHPDTVTQMLNNMTVLMEQVMDDPGLPLHAYTMVERDENGRAAALARGARLDWDEHATLHSLMAAQAERTPAAAAVRCNGVESSYAALNAAANRCAHYLLAAGVKSGDAVPVLLPPSYELIVALFAILKAGACFAPLGVQYPQARLTAIVEQIGARCVLTCSEHRLAFNAAAARVICIDDMLASVSGYRDDNPPPVDPGQRAYILHTSGSTGAPKGIEIAHRGVVNLLAGLQQAYALTARDRVLAHTSYTFDVFIEEVFWPLAQGSVVVMARAQMLQSGAALGTLMAQERVTLAQFVPATLDALVAARERAAAPALPALRQVICGGAALHRRLIDRFARAFRGPLANHYGPTEVTVDVCRFDCSEPFVGERAPLGRPLANTAVHLLDAHLQPVPCGLIGEIYVASPGLACGYLNDPAATARAFCEHVVAGTQQRLYKTGDLGRFDAAGLLYFHGRQDQQIKVRGNRVELAEIDSVLSAHPDIAMAAVRYHDDASHGGRLLAYVEQHGPQHQVAVPGRDAQYHYFSIAQRPELAPAAYAMLAACWPAHCQGDAVLARYWPRLIERYGAAQFVLTDAAGQVRAVGNAVPVWLDHTASASAPVPGWSDALGQAFEPQADQDVPNALYAFAGAWEAGRPTVSVLGASVLLRQYQLLAATLGLQHVVLAMPLETELEPVSAAAADMHGQLLAAGYGGGAFARRSSWLEAAAGPRRAHLTESAVKAYLRRHLPDYMVPDLIHFIARVPLTESGKVDVRSLPVIERQLDRAPQLPSTALQRELAALWCEVLKRDAIGIADDFFVLGGQSLQVIEMMAAVQQRHGEKVTLRQFYENPTIRDLEALLLHGDGAQAASQPRT